MILHITTPELWTAAQAVGEYRADSLASEGFIHCSTLAQIAATANKFYAGRPDLLLLYIDESKVSALVRFEDLNAGDRYPHIYGPLNLDAVLKTAAYLPGADGRFHTPSD